ncbi:MAG: VWA domain-containing protein [Acidobacteria bacterium]|nr:VWA domain-containing protein [Acidobacteriota bacterium]
MTVPLLGLLVAAAATAQAPAVFRAEVDLVRVEALVTRNGSPVRGLTAGDFEVRDAGRVQTLEPIHEEETPIDVVLVLDLSQSVDGSKLSALRDAAGAFLDGLHPSAHGADGERAALLAFQEEVRLLEPPTPALDRVRRALQAVTARGSTALHDATYSALRLLEPGPRRSAVVVFSDGLDSLSWLTSAQVVEAAARSDALLYAVVAREKGDPKNAFLSEVTRATGGRVWTARSEGELRARFLDVLGDIRSRYVLSYVPEGDASPGWHALEVRLKERRGEVLARPGYYRAGPPSP